MKLVCVAVLLILTCRVAGQDYIEYQRIFNRVDEDVLNNRFQLARQRLDTVYAGYDFIFARHCMKALQIACVMDDSILADRWLAKSFRQGIPLWVIRFDEIARKSLSYRNTEQTQLQYDSLRNIYKSSINRRVAVQVDSLMKIDFRYTQKVNNGFWPLRHTLYGIQWLRNNKNEFEALSRIMDEYGYPGEKLIGLLNIEDSAQNARFMARAGIGLGLEERTVLIMLLHYFSTPRRDLNDKLHREIALGNCTPHYCAHLNDFLAEYGKGRYGAYTRYYYHGSPPPGVQQDSIDLRRHRIGLNTVAQQQRNTELERERWKTHHSRIILE